MSQGVPSGPAASFRSALWRPWNHRTRLSSSKETPRSRSVWTVLFVLSVLALIAVVSFGSGIVAERYLFGGPGLGTDRVSAALETDGDPETDAAFPRQAEVREILEDEYFFLPASPEARATFGADLEQGAIAEWRSRRRRRWPRSTTTAASSTTARRAA